MGRILMGYWDCDKCDRKRIPGSLRQCPGCGSPRGDDTKFYMDGSSPALSQEESAAISKKPDWHCRYCGSLNPDAAQICPSCGHGRDEEDRDYFAMHEAKKGAGQKAERPIEAPARQERRKKPLWVTLGIILALVIALPSLIWALSPKQITTPVIDKAWGRSISIEKYQLVEESGWSLPDGAELLQTRDEIHHYESVFSHYEEYAVTRTRIAGYDTVVTGTRDLGNGYFEEITSQVPIEETYTEYEQRAVYVDKPRYQPKYYYTVWRWKYERSVATDGGATAPYWGDPALGNQERESGRSDSYTLYILHKEEKLPCAVPFEVWDKIALNEQHTFELSAWSDVRLIE